MCLCCGGFVVVDFVRVVSVVDVLNVIVFVLIVFILMVFVVVVSVVVVSDMVVFVVVARVAERPDLNGRRGGGGFRLTPYFPLLLPIECTFA